jgi:1-aminocyclopropane-1-carboxylate deaminase
MSNVGCIQCLFLSAAKIREGWNKPLPERSDKQEVTMQHEPVIQTDIINWKTEKGNEAHCTVARLDLIHPFISGNKYFKLKYNIEEAVTKGKGIITMGGTFSNHLAATAYACKEAGIASIGIVRGELTEPFNPTLQFCTNHQMKLIAVQRKDFDRNADAVKNIIHQHPDFLFVPEGGDNANGEKGCTEIAKHIKDFDSFTHICSAVGTGTTFRGIAQSARQNQTYIAVPVLKIRDEEQEQFTSNHLTTKTAATVKFFFEYSRNGYAKRDDAIIQFMNRFFNETNVPLDFIYTGKLLMAVSDLFERQMLTSKNKVLLLHTGGLQGNQSLPPGTLHYERHYL